MHEELRWKRLAGNDYGTALEEFAKYREFLGKRRTLGPLEDEEVMAAKLGNDWLLGCDPEFLVLDNKGQIVNTAGVLGKDGDVGYDHNGHVVELRPQPAKGTYMIVKRMKKMIDENVGLQKLREYKWRAGALYRGVCLVRDGLANENGERTLTLGGHVHLDMQPNEGNPDFKNLLDAMDRLTNHLEQLEILPKTECLQRRDLPEARRLKYGQWNDWRKAGPNNQRMEYRVMASWLYHPHTAYVCLTGAKLCAIAPMLANEYLRPRACAWSNLRHFFEAFRHRDSNARRLCEKLLDGRELKFLQHDPGVNFQETWRTLGL